MIRKLLILLILCWSIIAKGDNNENFITKNNKLYYKGILFTGEKIEEESSFFFFSRGYKAPRELKTIYQNGVAIKIYEKIYESEGIKENLSITNKEKFKIYIYDVDSKGIWINGTEYKKNYFKSETKEHIILNEKNEEITYTNYIQNYSNFTGTHLDKINGKLINKKLFKKGFLYQEQQYSPEGVLEYEKKLGKAFLRNYSGYERWYYSMGKIRKENKLKYDLEFIGPIDRFNDSLKGAFSPTGRNYSTPRKLIENRKMELFTKYYDLDENLAIQRIDRNLSFFFQGKEVSYKTLENESRNYPYVVKYYQKNSKGDLKLLESNKYKIIFGKKQYLSK